LKKNIVGRKKLEIFHHWPEGSGKLLTLQTECAVSMAAFISSYSYYTA